MTVEAASITPSSKARHYFLFTGTGKEYFGIWIVNLLLSIVTVGIYTAWAKVRRLRYFYGNTWLDGHNFEYHAKPIQILIGRIVAIILFAIINVVAELFPLALLAFIIPYALVFPWFINKALQFNSRMTSYRNVRFAFRGKYLTALWVFMILPVIVPIIFFAASAAYVFSKGGFDAAFSGLNQIDTTMVLGTFFVIAVLAYLLMFPFISKKTNEYIANNLQFGTAEFSASLSLKSLFKNAFYVLIPLLILIAVAGVIFAVGYSGDANFSTEYVVGTQVITTLIYVCAMFSYFAYKAGVRNIAYNATTLAGQHDLESNLPRFGYAWVLFSNLFVSIITIGLAIPWAAVRTWRYLATYTVLNSETDLESFVADKTQDGNVAAAEYLDIDGVDFGL